MISAICKNFLDFAAVMKAVKKAEKTVLFRFGGYVRRVAMNSIRRRKAAAPPGQPPSSHKGSLKNLIRFGIDEPRNSVVIGPMPFEGRSAGAKALEEGGTETIFNRQKKQTVQATYKARPFMLPAFNAAKPQLSAMWAGSVKP